MCGRAGSLVLIAMFAWPVCADNQADLQQHVAEAWTAVQAVLSDAAFAGAGTPLDLGSVDLSRPTGTVSLPAEEPAHPRGVFWCQDGRAGVDVRKGYPEIHVRQTCSLRCVTTPTDSMDRAACEAVASRFLERHAAWFVSKPNVTGPEGGPPDEHGVRRLFWAWRDDQGVLLGSAECAVRSIDGKVVTFTARTYGEPLPHRIGPAEACGVARKALAASVPGIEVKEWWLVPSGAPPQPVYDVELWSIDGATRFMVRVDANTGECISQKALPPPSSSGRKRSAGGADTSPTWSGNTLLFVSQRLPAALPDWWSGPSQVGLRTEDGQISYITCDAAARHLAIRAAAGGDTVLITRKDDGRLSFVWALDVRRGSSRMSGSAGAGANHATASPDGRWVVSEWEGREGHPDLFVEDLQRVGSLAVRRGRVSIPGVQDLPCFSPNGEQLYFIDLQEPYNQSRPRLVRLPTQKVLKTDLVKLLVTDEEAICDVPMSAKRLSITPNGERLVLQAEDGVYLASVPDKTCTKLNLGALVDPDLKVPVTHAIDAWAGPGNDQVTFSGQTTDAGGNVRRRIYCCRFDGSEFQALTPADDTPVPPYVFPKSKKGALELATEWALQEVHFERQWRAKTRGE